MKRLDLEPTDANILTCLNSNLALRNDDIKRFIALLDAIEPPFSICIDAPWGDGKTVFVKSIQMILEARNPQILTRTLDSLPDWVINEEDLKTQACEFLPVYFNAWSNDMLSNPLGSVIASIATDCEIDFADSNENLYEKAASIIDSIGGFFGHNPNIADLKKTLSGKQLIEEHQRRKTIEQNIDEYIDGVLRENANKLVLFIDELDRCRPEYAIRLLGDIKNLFENERIVIVYSADLEQLANALKGFYGNAFSTRKYLERFYDRRFEMTPIVKEYYYNGTNNPQYNNSRFDSIVRELLNVTTESMRDINHLKITLCAARNFAARRQANTDWSVAFAEAGLLPVFIFLEHEKPSIWRRVRLGQGFDDVLNFGRQSPSFMKFLDAAISGTYTQYTELNDAIREKYVNDLCCLIFLDANTGDPRRKNAYQDLGTHFWDAIDAETIRLLDFQRYSDPNSE